MKIPYETIDERTYAAYADQKLHIYQLGLERRYGLVLAMEPNTKYSLPEFISVGAFLRPVEPGVVTGCLAVNLCLTGVYGQSIAMTNGNFNTLESRWTPNSDNVLGFTISDAMRSNLDLTATDVAEQKVDSDKTLHELMASTAFNGFLIQYPLKVRQNKSAFSRTNVSLVPSHIAA